MKTNTYETAPATKMLSVTCLICGRPLVDAVSVQIGLGPECRREYDAGITEAVRIKANKLVHEAALSAGIGRITEVLAYAKEVEDLGLNVLADKMRRRFKNAETNAEITIEEVSGVNGVWNYRVLTPYRRSEAKKFVNAWRTVPGRRWENGANIIPITSKKELWSVLKKFFGGKYAKGPKGIFRIPAEPTHVQTDLNLKS